MSAAIRQCGTVCGSEYFDPQHRATVEQAEAWELFGKGIEP